jgi:hypothetical protein
VAGNSRLRNEARADHDLGGVYAARTAAVRRPSAPPSGSLPASATRHGCTALDLVVEELGGEGNSRNPARRTGLFDVRLAAIGCQSTRELLTIA